MDDAVDVEIGEAAQQRVQLQGRRADPHGLEDAAGLGLPALVGRLHLLPSEHAGRAVGIVGREQADGAAGTARVWGAPAWTSSGK